MHRCTTVNIADAFSLHWISGFIAALVWRTHYHNGLFSSKRYVQEPICTRTIWETTVLKVISYSSCTYTDLRIFLFHTWSSYIQRFMNNYGALEWNQRTDLKRINVRKKSQNRSLWPIYAWSWNLLITFRALWCSGVFTKSEHHQK